MEFSVKTGQAEKQKTACLVVGILESRKLSPSAKAVDEASDGYLDKIVRSGDMEGKLGTTLLLHSVPGLNSERVLLVGCGKERELTLKNYRKAVTASADVLENTGAADCVFTLNELQVRDQDAAEAVRHAVEQFEYNHYRFDSLKSKSEAPNRPLKKVTLLVEKQGEPLDAAKEAVRTGLAIAAGITLARDLGNLPGNICTPSYLAERAEKMGRLYPNLEVEVLDEAKMEELGMGSLLAVARGSRQPAKLIVMNYRGGQDEKPLTLVGKGVTFDTGGISLKPGEKMDEMKYDMCGAASVFGTLTAVAEMQLPVNLVGIVPSVENMPDGLATKPGDIVTSLSGQTIEILNTDAEGRLILCDALTYAGRFEPEQVIDIATLTGACIIALGRHACGVMGNHQPLVNALQKAGDKCYDRAWPLPLWEEYDEQLKSNFADMANIGGREAGTITAGCFLGRFTKDYHWAHLDVAGTAWVSGENKGATGKPVPLLTQFILDRMGK